MADCEAVLLQPFWVETQIDTKERTTIYSRPYPPGGSVAAGRSVTGSFCRIANGRNALARRGEVHVEAAAGTPGTARFGLVVKRTVTTVFRREDGCGS
jgi:hypothetical protein